ncbi:GrpB family protein [Polaromonas sp. YR568]|uniref:GrpB family protein n=1 Tax=Polaromonas sp. YR568 TaxID=1855301 RepID=UPI00398BE560
MTDAESLQAAIDEEVALLAYDPRWPGLFEAERARLQSLFPNDFIAIEHMGSTAVPGLAAKPVIDILAGVESMAAARALVGPLCANGYTASAEFNAGLADRQWLMRWAEGHRTHHLHLVVHGGPLWAQRLRFRDALRGDAALAARYAALKAGLAAQYPRDREAYTEAKAVFVRAVCEG